MAMEALVAYYRKHEAEVPDFTRRRDARRRQAAGAAGVPGPLGRRRRRRPCRCRRCSRAAPAGASRDLTFAQDGHGHAVLRRAPAVRGRRAAVQGARQRLPHRRRTYEPTEASAKGATGPATTVQGGRSGAGHAALRPDQGAPLRRRHRSAAGGLRAGRVVVRHDRAAICARPERRPERAVATGGVRGSAAASTTSSVTTTACCCSRRASAKAITRSPTSSAPPPPAPSGRRRRTRRRCTSRRCSAGPRRRRSTSGSDDAARAWPPASCAGGAALAAAPRAPPRVRRTTGRRSLARRRAWLRLGPLPAGLLDEADACVDEVVDRHGEVLYEARSIDGTREMRLRRGSRCRRRWSARRSPPRIAASSRISGVDPLAIARATWRNLAALDRVEGGSTITQQVGEAAARPARAARRRRDARGAAGARRSRKRSSRCASSTGCRSARSSRST